MNSKHSWGNGGFSLVEIALAIGVISFSLVGLMGLVASTQSIFKAGIERTDGSLLFQKVVNQLKLKPFDKAQDAGTIPSSVLPLPALTNTDPARSLPFLVDERCDYVGSVDDPEALAKASKVVRVIVMNATDLMLADMRSPTPASSGQIAHVRIEISGPPLGYRDDTMSAPEKQVFFTDISLIEQ